MRMKLNLLISALCVGITSGIVVECPDPNAAPVEVDVSGTTKPRHKVTIKRSLLNTSCSLYRVVPRDGVLVTDFSETADSKDFILEPVLRSFDKKPWQALAGPYSNKSKIFNCDKNNCLVNFRVNREGTYKYVLMTFENAFQDASEDRARFLAQTTFGPKMSEITGWSYAEDINGFADWMQNQMDVTQTPISSHREYYRKYLDWSLVKEFVKRGTVVPQDPCSQYSRWRDYAVTGDDYGIEFVVSEIVVDGVTKYLITVGGEPRTVVDSFASTDGYYSGAGTYNFGYGMGEGINENVYFNQNQGATKVMKNPKIFLPTQIIDDTSLPLKHISLPSIDKFEKIDGVAADQRFKWYVGASYRMLESNQDSECGALVSSANYQNLVGTVAGSTDQFHYEGYADVAENSVGSPLADGGASKLPFTSAGNKLACVNAAMDFTNIDSCRLADGVACVNNGFSGSTYATPSTSEGVVICGSNGEVGNDPNNPAAKTNRFRFFETASSVFFDGFGRQKGNVWSMVALEAPDQLRQRVAWALSQILVVTPNQIDNADLLSECFLNYYDIFVRNAFGNYRDVLKEVSYSPMMAEMLSFLESRSAAYVKRVEERVSRPDENYAREIMQLFTIGIHKLRPDGSVMKRNGTPIPTYENSDIQNFARAWTGFRRQYSRSNFEGYWSAGNRIDPMPIDGPRRDQFPKMDLYRGFIGDDYPLCIEEPEKQFLRVGATYRLIGSHKLTTMHYENQWERTKADLTRVNLSTSSALHQKLCNQNASTGNCEFQPQVVLDQNLACGDTSGAECKVDNVRLVRVQENPEIFYEYLKPPCVELAFSKPDELSKIVDHQKHAMCLHKEINDAAMPSCCPATGSAQSKCEFSMERVSFKTSNDRCTQEGLQMCDFTNIYFPEAKCQFYGGTKNNYRTFHWSNKACSIQAKVAGDGTVALIHNPNLDISEAQTVWPSVDETNINFFKVKWIKPEGYPSSANQCGGSSECTALPDGECLCNVDVTTKRIFNKLPTLTKIANRLKIGSHDPQSFDDGTYTLSQDSTNDILVYAPAGLGTYTKETVFGVVRNGKLVFLKNCKSQVQVAGTSGVNSTFIFRNPPSFMSLVTPESRDAHYETDAVIDHYFYHPNTPTVIAIRLLQRFGFSNPTPRHISIVSKAFRSGIYRKVKKNITFGDSKYGNLEATIAAILLDREARKAALDVDPASGALREPILKYLGFLRSMEFEQTSRAHELRLHGLQESIGQYVHQTPNVFSFFLPEYSAPGQITDSSLASPEAQVMNAPNIVGLLNGMYSIIDTGLSQCFGGFGGRAINNCNTLAQNPSNGAHGLITYQPTGTTAEGIVDELALLLTGGKLNSASRTLIQNAYTTETAANGAASGLRYAQKLMIATPEYHSTNAVSEKGEDRPDPPDPQPSTKEYKAIVFVNLHGGMDGFQMLVPMDGCTNPSSGQSYDLYDNYKKARGEIALIKGTLKPITVSNQVCTQFGLHSKLGDVQTLYNDKDLSFIANMGILQQSGVTKDNWRTLHDKTALFAHNTQTEETANIDVYDTYAGIGICGRIIDELTKTGYNTGAISVSGAAPPMVSKSTPLLVVNPFGYAKFHPNTRAKDVTADAKKVNGVSNAGSTFYGEAWSETLVRALSENALLFEKYNAASPGATFENTSFGRQLSAVSKLIATKDDRGKDRDVFFLERPGFDMHFDIEIPLENAFKELNHGLKTFKQAMVAQNKWDDVTVVLVSEFARTLMGNTGNGSDHAWGGNYIIASGALDGGKVLGTFPDDLSNDGEVVFPPGIVIPTTPWESLWDPIARWFGVADDALDKVLPNRAAFADRLLNQEDVFKP